MSHARSLSVSVLTVLAFTLCGAHTFAQQMYDLTIIDYGGFGGRGWRINNAGQMLGIKYATFGGDTTAAALRQVDGTILDLGNLGSSDHTFGRDINNAGTVVGGSTTGSAYHAFEWNQGTGMIDRGLGMNESEMHGVNNFGQAVGMSVDTNNFSYRATKWQNGVQQFIAPAGTYSTANAINDNGDSAGSIEVGGFQRAFIHSAGGAFQIYDMSIGGNPTDRVYVADMNNAGQIVGTSYSAGSPYSGGYIIDNNVMIDLGSLGGTETQAYGINNIGDVVGKSLIGNGMNAFIWSNGVMTNLNNLVLGGMPSGFRLYDAYGINDLGQITGGVTTENGHFYGYILTQHVPSPSGMFPLGFATLFAIRRRR
jgi:probable HAF family extracellular repeat protein